ncbi:hypothetical protein BJY16_006655 [Actinoplanes octamycinicus]|uniref:Uncharacterized protein n=1 Tax=Actinoplanes octamycinicus TaxID=135948 RepID=A0A7W7H389_9ACTN|nr:hypothetical protein [Actinoplanes octamycinicus]MBB4743196.1 hypothetical protein [Actinoplanes octamycinicus]GIE61240.1 hypothetical protein Aoc01nite_66420 [Actinoplanes octamycinicus]
MEPRALTERERAVLDALLAVDFEGVEELRRQAAGALVVGTCACGCPSIDFQDGVGLTVRVDATVRGGYDQLFLYTFGERLGGIEWAGVAERPAEFPPPERLEISVPPPPSAT